MSKISRLEAKLPEIEKYFTELSQKVFNSPELLREFTTNKEAWDLPVSVNFEDFVKFLLIDSKLVKNELHCEKYQNISRFSWGEPSVFALALSVKSHAYLTHGSAIFLHNLIDKSPQTIYVNHEQSPKPQYGTLSQDGIHRAFGKQQRQTNLIYTFNGSSIVVTNGKNSGQSGVVILPNESGEKPLIVTGIERTLIDITVRPAYAGGASVVLEAYRRAKNLAKIETLLKTLKKLDYIYPYHQAIGFFMEKADYPKKAWQKLLNLGVEYEFYADHQLPSNKKFDAKWKIYYPAGL